MESSILLQLKSKVPLVNVGLYMYSAYMHVADITGMLHTVACYSEACRHNVDDSRSAWARRVCYIALLQRDHALVTRYM